MNVIAMMMVNVMANVMTLVLAYGDASAVCNELAQ
ncbi:MAG: hypothetical protein ACI8W7_000877 [Gammaproteobacteria bacterium]|jgi:hypothetical protein